jgi:hypothetical protein
LAHWQLEAVLFLPLQQQQQPWPFTLPQQQRFSAFPQHDRACACTSAAPLIVQPQP